MWRAIKPNASTAGLGRIVSVACQFERIEPEKRGGPVTFRAVEIAARCCTVRGGAATRKSQYTFERWGQLWTWLHKIGNSGNPITIVCSDSSLTVPSIGVFEAIDSGGLRLEWPGEQRKSSRAPEASPKTVAGIVCLTAPPTIIIGRMCSGAIVRVVDIANWGITEDDLWSIYSSQYGDGEEDIARLEQRYGGTHHYTAQAIELSVLWLLETVRTRSLGMFRWTAASQASAAWRHGRMSAKVIVHDEKPVQDLEQRAYYGGRIDVWFARKIQPANSLLPQEPYVPPWGPTHKPEGPIYGLDVNGLFGVCMRDHLYPRCLVDWRIVPKGSWSGRLDEPGASIAEVVIETAGEEYPVKVSGKTIYPRGCYETVLAGPELRRAVDRGRVLRVGSWARYELGDLFSACVGEFWGYRLAADGNCGAIERRYWKRMINSLYGKFGQRRKGWTSAPGVQAPGPWQTWYTVDQNGKPLDAYRSIGRHVQRMEDAGPGRDSFCAVAAFVASYSRLVMDRIRELVGNGHYYYSAIDSIYCDITGYNKLVLAGLVHPTELGMLRHEGTWKQGHFKGLGHYELDGESTVAGRSLDAEVDSVGRWIETVVPGLDHQVTGRPLVEPKCTVQVGNWTRINVPGTMNGTGWVRPPEMGLQAKR